MDWTRIEKRARPGDVLLLRREFPPKARECVVDLIHFLGETYDHAALVVEPDSKGRVQITHATKDPPIVDTIALADYRSRAFCVQAELRRHSRFGWWRNPSADDIVCNAELEKWTDVRYAYGDLLLAGLAATGPQPGQDPHAVAVLRSRVLALCIAVLSEEFAMDTVAVTCASFVNACHDGKNELATPFTTVGQRLEELASGTAGGADWSMAAKDEIDLYLRRLRDEKTPVYALMNEKLCPTSVTKDDSVPHPGLITYLGLRFLRRLKDHVKAAAPARQRAYAGDIPPSSGTSGAAFPTVTDGDRLLVTIEDLRNEHNLRTVQNRFML